MPVITVIVPVYKAEKYIHRCIDSILAQTFTDFELILVDDGSPDNCGMICDEYAEKDNRIHVIHQSNQGQASARNNAINNAQGKYICFIDSDDAVHPQMLEVLLSAAETNDAGIAVCGVEEGTDMSEGFLADINAEFCTDEVDEHFLLDWIKRNNFHCSSVCAALLDTEIVKKYSFATGKIYEDSAICLWWLKAAERITITEEKLYFYQVNDTGTTKSNFSLKRLDGQWSMGQRVKFCIENDYLQLGHVLGNTYIRKAVTLYNNILSELDDKKAAAKLRKDTMRFYQKNKEKLFLTFADNIYAFEVFYPQKMKLYWYIQAIKKRLHIK